MNIRRATREDAPALIRMGLDFLHAHYADKLGENPAQMGHIIATLLDNAQARIFIAENGSGPRGMLAFVLYSHFFSGEPVAGELVWWVDPDARGRTGLELLRHAEVEAHNMGAKWMQMVSPSERTSALYERLGYSRVETMFQRKL